MFTLADLTRMSGAKRRTVQLWAEGGALLADPVTERQGSGVHRIFNRDEAVICLILSRVEQWHVSIGRLRQIAAGIRTQLQTNSAVRNLIEATVTGVGTATLALHADGGVTLLGGLREDLPPYQKFGETRQQELLMRLSESNRSCILIFLDGALSALRAVKS
jgi:hypothetical protein